MAICPVMLYPTTPAQNTTGSTPSIHHGGDTSFSLGGQIAAYPLRALINPFRFESMIHADMRRTPGSAHRLFQDFTAAQLTAGRTSYRGLMVRNVGGTDLTDLQVWLTQNKATGASVKVLSGTENTALEEVANDTTAPAGSFTAPTSSAKLTLSADFAESDYIGLWIEHTLGAATAAYPYDYFGVHFGATGYSTKSFFFYNHLQAGVTITSVTSDRSGSRTYAGLGETFTVLTKNGSSVLTDPGRSKVFVVIDGPSEFGQSDWGDSQQEFPGMETTVGLCQRSSAGTYTFQWRPTTPGFYRLQFDVGESFSRIERNCVP